MAKIEQLTPEQEQAMIAHRDKWIAIGLATGEANVDALRPVFERFYGYIDKPVPEEIIRVASPLSAQATMKKYQPGNSVYIPILRLPASIQENHSLRDPIGDSIAHSVWTSVWASIGTPIRDVILEDTDPFFYGQNGISWIAEWQFYNKLGKLRARDASIMDDWQTIAENCDWWYPFEDVVFVGDRPSAIYLNENGRLHHETEAAVQFSDGFGVYSYHGVRVPEKVITSPESITVEDIQDEGNAEIQRVMIERYGYERYVKDSGAVEIQRDKYGVLYRIPTGEDGIIVVNVTCPSSGGLYWLSVPEYIDEDLNPADSTSGKAIETAHEAVAWTWGMRAEMYNPIIET